MSPIELLEKPVSETPEPAKRRAASQKQLKRKSENEPEDLLFFVLFFMPVVTFCFVQAMTSLIRLQIGDALVWEQNANYWASLSRQFGQGFCLVLLVPAAASFFKKKPVLPRTSATLAILFMMLSFAFAFGAPKYYPAPAPAPVQKPVIKPAPAPEPVAVVEPAPAPAPVAEVKPAKRKGWFILFPLFTKTETALSIIFPLHFQIEKENGTKYFWLLPYTSRTWEANGRSYKNSTFLYPFYTRSEEYSEGKLVSAKRNILFVKKEWQNA